MARHPLRMNHSTFKSDNTLLIICYNRTLIAFALITLPRLMLHPMAGRSLTPVCQLQKRPIRPLDKVTTTSEMGVDQDKMINEFIEKIVQTMGTHSCLHINNIIYCISKSREIVLMSVQRNGLTLYNAATELQEDREVVLAAVTQNGYALQYAATELQEDREVVLAAVTQNGGALKYAGTEFQGDREIVLTAVKQNWVAYLSMSNDLKTDREILLAALAQEGRLLYDTHDELRSDMQVMLCAIKTSGTRALRALPEPFDEDLYFLRLARRADLPKCVQSFLAYARDLREAQLKAKVDLWLTKYNDGQLHHWLTSTNTTFKRRKRTREMSETT